MAIIKLLCVVCSKALISSNNAQQKLLKTPFGHVFHRTCLKNWLRRQSVNNYCPECSTLVTWRQVIPFHINAQANKAARLQKQDIGDDTSVVSLVEENRKKKAEILIQKRNKKDSKVALLELQKQETLKRQQKLAEKKKIANIKDKMCKGYERRNRIRFLKRVVYSILFAIAASYLAVYCYYFYKKATQPEIPELLASCLQRSKDLQGLYDEYFLRLEAWEKTGDPFTFDEKISWNIERENIDKFAEELLFLYKDYNITCVQMVDLTGAAPNYLDLLTIQAAYTGDGWSIRRSQKAIKWILDAY